MRGFAMVVVSGLALVAQAQAGDRETNTKSPEHPSGQVAAAPIPPALHQKNTGGSDGAGLCVIASVKTAGEYLQLQKDVAALWDYAKRLPGGYYDGKFDRLAKRIAPNLKYGHYHGTDYEVLKRLSDMGLPFGITMDTGELYGNKRVAHMVTGVSFRDDLACYIDNNSPGMFTWVNKEEWERRSKLATGEFWILALMPSEDWVPPSSATGSSSALGAGLAVAGVAAFVWKRRQSHGSAD